MKLKNKRKTKTKTKTKTTKMKIKTTIKNKKKCKQKQKRKWKQKFFHFCELHVAFFAFFASFCILLTPRAIDGQLSLDSPRSAIAPRSMPPSLIQLCTIQLSCSLFLFLIRNTFFGQIWSIKSKLSVEAEIWYLH